MKSITEHDAFVTSKILVQESDSNSNSFTRWPFVVFPIVLSRWNNESGILISSNCNTSRRSISLKLLTVKSRAKIFYWVFKIDTFSFPLPITINFKRYEKVFNYRFFKRSQNDLFSLTKIVSTNSRKPLRPILLVSRIIFLFSSATTLLVTMLWRSELLQSDAKRLS